MTLNWARHPRKAPALTRERVHYVLLMHEKGATRREIAEKARLSMSTVWWIAVGVNLVRDMRERWYTSNLEELKAAIDAIDAARPSDI